MYTYFKNLRFKVLLIIMSVVLLVSAVVASIGGYGSPQSAVVGAITNPIEGFSTGLSTKANNFFHVFSRVEELEAENEQLKKENQELNSALVNSQQLQQENDNLKEYLSIQDQDPNMQMVPALLTSSDPNNHFGAFTIDAGSIAGVSPNDPVITADGLVGYVTTVNPTYSIVTTILDPNISVGAYDSRTSDAGIVTGDVTYSLSGSCVLTLLPRENSVAVGDYIVTSSVGGLYPENLIIGTVTAIQSDPHDISMVAVVQPSAYLDNLKNVMVITSFTGQGDTGGVVGETP